MIYIALERHYKQNPTNQNRSKYVQQVNLCRRMIKEKRFQFNTDTIQSIGNCQKSLFRFVNSISNNSKSRSVLPNNHSSDLQLANSFNKYFISKVKKIRSALPEVEGVETANPIQILDTDHIGPDSVMSDDSTWMTHFSPCNEAEISEILKIAGINVSPRDILPAHLLKSNIDFFLPYLTWIVNLSLSCGNFDGLKEAYVRPLLKEHNLDQNTFANYRPISNLSFISKIIERVVLKRLQKHMDTNNLNSHKQFGYKKRHGTETLHIKFLNDLLVAIDSKKGVVVLLMDLSSAFDTVDHRKLLNILFQDIHITGTALKWFKSYLMGRSQRVMVGSSISEPLELSFGVPQGSVLGPVLFNLYIRSLPSAFSDAKFNCLGYADDNLGYQVFTISAEADVFSRNIPHCIDKIKSWMNNYFLKLNDSKTKVIVFGNTHFLNSLSTTELTTSSNDVIKVVDSVKYLGVYLDKHLSFVGHVNKITSHCYSLLRNIGSIRRFLSQSQCETLVHAVISSRVDYCNSVFFGLPKSTLQKLVRVQSSASKLILRRGRRHGLPSPVRLDILHWLSIEKRIIFRILVHMFNCFKGSAPIEMLCLLVPYIGEQRFVSNSGLDNEPLPFYSYDTRFYFPKSSFGRRAFSFAGPRLWNCIPLSLRSSMDIKTFKKNLKTYLWTHFDELMSSYRIFF